MYQATDSNLGRGVAIKVLPAAFASGAERLSRFRFDFGLVKAYETSPSHAVISYSPTMVSMGATNAGVILGTAAYMSPEAMRRLRLAKS